MRCNNLEAAAAGPAGIPWAKLLVWESGLGTLPDYKRDIFDWDWQQWPCLDHLDTVLDLISMALDIRVSRHRFNEFGRPARVPVDVDCSCATFIGVWEKLEKTRLTQAQRNVVEQIAILMHMELKDQSQDVQWSIIVPPPPAFTAPRRVTQWVRYTHNCTCRVLTMLFQGKVNRCVGSPQPSEGSESCFSSSADKLASTLCSTNDDTRLTQSPTSAHPTLTRVDSGWASVLGILAAAREIEQ